MTMTILTPHFNFLLILAELLFLEANHSENRVLPLFFATDIHPESLTVLLQNHMRTIYTITAHAQEV